MAGGSLLALIDKIAVVLDDVAVMTKVAAKKTAGVLGDDLALNAQQVSGVRADRELPVVYAVFKGSVVNKLILVPLALVASTFFPWLITPMLMIGGAYLCFEGAEKIIHSFAKADKSKPEVNKGIVNNTATVDVSLKQLEQDKIKGAIKTDFVLSAEIIVISLGTVQSASFYHQLIVVSVIAAIMTIGVYGLVAAIVKLDDAGLYLLQTKRTQWLGKIEKFVGQGLLSFAPWLMKTLAIVGTIAMFLVGGSIIFHDIHYVHDIIKALEAVVAPVAFIGEQLAFLASTIMTILLGFIAGLMVFLLITSGTFLVDKFTNKSTKETL